MTTLATFNGRTIDTARLDDDDLRAIQELHGAIQGRDASPLRCLNNGGGLTVAKVNGSWFLRHFPGDPCGAVHRIAPETDDHKRAKDYLVGAAQRSGLHADTERPSPAGTRPDVTITGGKVIVGAEAQHSPITIPAAKTRTTRNFNGGVLSMWYADAPDAPWVPAVPAVSSTIRGAFRQQMPKPESVAILGIVNIDFRKCTYGAFRRCPAGNRTPCGKFHPATEPRPGITLDGAVVGVAAGRYVPVPGDHGPIIVTAEDRDRMAAEGLPVDWNPGIKRGGATTALSTRICRSVAHDISGTTQPLAPGQFACPDCGCPLAPGRVRCQACYTSRQIGLWRARFPNSGI
jgi:hypothetical protein